ncbi:hypothetical protein SAMN05421788_11580 [Filimonas lacunae]|uniref:Uncharacterized protein n=1 Tax=Filimonas lacunae TaxID=477680 RepID=A0A173MC91_9BACT|nr:hypothetical protein [Filimonas lacunae]BAV05078.1 hypothetical protein FLA_1085 [Filimonas lacunae]SIT34260.1 hypothetical protein SAMN05421788_11580 [Filimonas lacunae]
MQTGTTKEASISGTTPVHESAQGKETKSTETAPKDWLNQLSGVMPEGKEGMKQIYQLLSNPLIVIAGLCLLAYWLFTQKQQQSSNPKSERLRKQVKKIKKRYKQQQLSTTTNNATTGISVID